MATAICGPYTIDDLDELQFEEQPWPRFELLDGWLLASPLVNPLASYAHQRVCTRLATKLEMYGSSSRTAQVTSPGGVVIPPRTALLPDVLVLPGRTSPIDWESVSSWLLAVEVLSPSTRKVDLGMKREKYLEIGIPEVWFVDPVECTVRIARSGTKKDTTLASPDVITFREKLAIDLTAVFSDD